MTTIEKIRAEIERLIEESDFDESANLYSLLSFLDTLESEKPISQNEDFEKEIADYWTTMGWSRVMTLAKFKVIARYFYGLGLGVNDKSEKPMQEGLDVTDFCKPIDPGIAQCIADHSWEMLGEDEKPVPNDLEEAAMNYIAPIENEDGLKVINFSGQDIKDAFIAGAKWQKEHSFTHHETNESLEEAVTHQMEDDGDVDDFIRKGLDKTVLKYAQIGAEWQKQHGAELIEIAYNDGITIGMTKQKEEMLKEAVEGEVVKDINNKLAVTAKNVNLDKFKFGDKVRIIICKKED